MNYILDITSAYRDNPNAMTLGELLTDGIKATMVYCDDFGDGHTVMDRVIDNTKQFRTEPLARYLGLCAIYSFTAQGLEPAAKLKAQADFLNAVYKTYRQYQLPVNQENPYDAKLIDMVRTEMLNSKPASESVITSCAPIVPYVGTLTKPMAQSNESTVSNEMITNSVTRMEALIKDPKLVMEIFSKPEMVGGKSSSTPKFIFDAASKSNGASKEFLEYCTHSYIVANPEIASNGIYKSLNTIQNFPKCSFNEAFESMMSLVPESVGETEDLAEDLERDTIVAATPDDNFDLTALMNYILSHKRFRANHWTNSGYSNIPHLASVSFYREFMLIRPADADNKPLDYLYVPVVDDLAGSTVMVIKYWMDGRIDVLSQDQYAIDINRTVGEQDIPEQM